MFSSGTIKAEKLFFKKLFLKMLVFILVVCLCVYLSKNAKIRQKQNYNKFFTSQINQKISKAYASAGFMHMTLKNGEHFSSKLSGPKNGEKGIHLQFSDLAEKGDSISKEANSNIITLFHGNKKLIYEAYEE